jgi:hypothetical protein
MRRFTHSLFAAALFAGAASPAAASTMLATWQGVIASGSVSSQSGGLVDGLAQGDYSGQAFTATFLYDTAVQPGQMSLGNATASYLFGGAGFGPNPVLDAYIVVAGVKIDLLAPSGLVQQQHAPNGLIEQQSDNSWSGTSFLGGNLRFENYDRGLTLAAYGDFPAALDFGLDGNQSFSADFASDLPGYGSAADCDTISAGGVNITPYCLSFSLRPDSLTVIDPPPPGVPEPAQWALLLTGFGFMGTVLRSQRRKPKALPA